MNNKISYACSECLEKKKFNQAILKVTFKFLYNTYTYACRKHSMLYIDRSKDFKLETL